MRNLSSVKALLLFMRCLLCIFGSESSTVEVQSGQSVTLLCSNFTSSSSLIYWFRSVRRSTPGCICTIFKPFKPATLCDGIPDEKFTATSNLSHIFVTIKSVSSSDSGLYFCGFLSGSDPVVKQSTYLDVQEEYVFVPILASLVVFLMAVVIGLAVKNKKLQKAHNQELHAQTPENLHCSDNLHYAAVTFHPKQKRSAVNSKNDSTIYSSVR